MYRNKTEVISEKKLGPFDGKGEIFVRELLRGPEEMYKKGRVFAHTTVYPGSEIGYHIHEKESETYYFLSGEGIFNDNGIKKRITAGDVTFTGAGEGHGLVNEGNVPIEMIALILYQ